jgi:hypothetical protein
MLAFFVGFISEMFRRSNGDPNCPRCHGTGRWADRDTRTMRNCGCAHGVTAGGGESVSSGGGSHVLRWVIIVAVVVFVVLPILGNI